MQVTDGVTWSAFDFAFVAVIITVGATILELTLRRAGTATYRVAVAVGVAAAVLLIVVTGAVGIIGTESHDANLLYGAVLAVAITGAGMAGLRPKGMALATAAAALAQALIAAVAVAARWGSSQDPDWPGDIIGVTALLVGLWLVSAWLFWKSARRHDSPVA
jgi:hypothetical protein